MERTVETRSGRIRGVEQDGLAVFRGVPFAKPPVGKLRFRAPQAPEPWSHVRDATEFGPTAPQAERQMQMLPGPAQQEQRSEDCLYLNVYTPGVDAARRPTLVWIHGGGFTGGSGSSPMYDGVPLAKRGDAVVVTLNYRLGALGFIDLSAYGGDEFGATANPGLLDQIAALGWVRENVERFGGDPDNVTIFGESAGGMSVGSLLGMPAARGLFRRAIAQSGAAHNVHASEAAAAVAEALLGVLDIPVDQAQRLHEVPVERLVEAQTQTMQKTRRIGSLGMAFSPVVDGKTIAEPPIETIRAGGARAVTVLVGTTRDEWNLFRMMDPQGQKLDAEGVVKRLGARLPGANARTTAERVYETYRKAHEGRTSTEPIDLFCAIETDRIFRIPAIRLAEAQRPHNESTYTYLFTWESPLLEGRLGSCHALELPFVFGTLTRPGMSRFAGEGPQAERLSERMMDAWLAFARDGDPGHAELPEWAPYDEDRRATMVLGAEAGLEPSPFDDERRAWDGIL